MTPAEGIRKHGFRTWYERQLIESHVYFITGFMSAVLIMALLEDINLRGPGPLSKAALAVVIGAGLLTAFAMQRYLSVLMRKRFPMTGRLQVLGPRACANWETLSLFNLRK